MDLTNEQWQRIADFVPAPKAQPGCSGRPPRDPRAVLNGILWILRTGAPWKDLPQRYPPRSTCHRRFQQWAQEGIFEKIFTALAEDLRDRGGIAANRHPRRQKASTLQTLLENRTAVRVAAKLQAACRPLRIPSAKLLGHNPARMYRHPPEKDFGMTSKYKRLPRGLYPTLPPCYITVLTLTDSRYHPSQFNASRSL